MNNDIEKLLNQVGVPTGHLFKDAKHRKLRMRFISIVGSLSLMIILIFIFSGYRNGNKAIKIQNSNSIQSNNETVNKVSKLIIIPQESPVIAIISEVKLLGNNVFFDGAKEGDRVLVFKGADKAILYSPETNKILNVGTIKETGIKW